MKLTLSGVLLMLSMGLIWLTLGQGESIPMVITVPGQQLTQSYLHNAERWSYNTEGYRDQQVTIESGISYTDNPVTYLKGLSFSGPDNNGRHWQVEAGAGLLKTQTDELQLTQGVEIRESGGEGVLTTPRLRILSRQNKAVNNAPVTLRVRDSITTARGLEVNLDTGVAKLLKNVETLYEG